ncbi:CIA30 family protein [Sulfitobacter sp.]|uniref:CIA30 family protein n=1 Tax=Sulfitobacter sp. TaxID=1903071 RepID=UPI00329A1553
MTGFTQWIGTLLFAAQGVMAQEQKMELTPEWEYVADTVMGGVSSGGIAAVQIAGREAMALRGTVSLDNNGGFIQMAFDLDEGRVLDASGYAGIEIDVAGNGATYELRLRTDQLARPWQSYRAEFQTSADWQTLRLPWTSFVQNKTDVTFDPARLRRIGVLAYGVEMQAYVAVAGVRFYP